MKKSVFITGAGAGIGQATARLFAKHGWFVGLYDVNEGAVKALHHELGQDNSCFGQCNVTDVDAIKQALAHFAKHSNNQMHAFINNAGVLFGGEFTSVDLGKHQLTIDINISGLTNCAYLAFDMLKATPDSHLINLCSVSSLHGVPTLSTYSASKFYVKGLTEALNIEWQQHDINVSAILPPFVKTNMLNGVPPMMMETFGVEKTAEDIADEIYALINSRQIHRVVSFKGKFLKQLLSVCSNKINRAIFKQVTGYNK